MGSMAFEQVLGVLEVCDIEKSILYNRTQEKTQTFKERLVTLGIKADIEVVDNPKKVFTQSGFLNCAT